MSAVGFIKKELKEMLEISSFFFLIFVLIALLFKLLLEDYDISSKALPKAIISALIMGKVILILQNLSFMNRFSNQPGIVQVLYKTAVYMAGVYLALALEKVIEAYGKAGGIIPAFEHVVETRTMHHVLAVTLLMGATLAAYNCWEVILREVGRDKLAEAFLRKNTS